MKKIVILFFLALFSTNIFSLDVYLDNNKLKSITRHICPEVEFVNKIKEAQLVFYNGITNNIKKNKAYDYTVGIEDLLYLEKREVNENFIYSFKNYKKIIPYHFENIVLIKSLVGDNSDNIEKVQRVTVNYLMKEFPELSEREITLGYLLNKLQEKNKLKVADKNLLNIDKKKHNLIKKIVNLINNQYLTEEIIDNVNLIKEGELAIYNEEKKYFRGGSNLYSILQGTEVLKNYLGFTTPFKDKYLHFITPFCKIIYHEQKKLLNSNVILKEEKEFLDNSIKKTKKIYIKHETDKKQIEERKRF